MRLRIRQETLFEVSHAASRFSDRVAKAVQSSIEAASADTTGGAESASINPPVLSIPRTAVDAVIQSYHKDNHITYGLYLLHPSVRGLYQYTHDGGEVANQSDDKRHLFPGGCGYIGWVGQNERYAWLDLGVHVPQHGWGPRTRALGVMSPSTFPNLAETAAAVRQGGSDFRLYLELAGLVHRTASQLIVPPLLFAPAGLMGADFRTLTTLSSPARWSDYAKGATPDQWRREKVVVIHLFLICQVSPCPEDEARGWKGLDELFDIENHEGQPSGRDGIMPRVTIKREEIALWESPLLTTGLQQSMRSARGVPRGSLLAASELRRWLRLFLDERRERIGGSDGYEAGNVEEEGGVSDGNDARVVPVFAFSLEADPPLLLDHSVRSTAFPDMVISVNSRHGTTIESTFQCGGRNVMLQSGVVRSGENHREYGGNVDGGLLRDTFASLAQLVWGAPPRSLSWDPVTETLGTDYLWAAGASIDTPLSSHTSLTFAERDAYSRAHILRRVDAAVGAAHDVLAEAAAVEPRLVRVLYAGDYAEVMKSWSGIQENLKGCFDYVGVHEHESAVHSIQALENHVGNLGAALSRGYGHEAYRRTCHCEAPEETAFGRMENVGVMSAGRKAGRAKRGDMLPFAGVVLGFIIVIVSVCGAFGAWYWSYQANKRDSHGWRVFLRKVKYKSN